jgi:hypothetical protein
MELLETPGKAGIGMEAGRVVIALVLITELDANTGCASALSARVMARRSERAIIIAVC